LNCHPIKYIVEDDGGDPSRHQAQVQQLVEQQHVLAFVYMNASVGDSSQSADYLKQKRIPVVGTEGGESWAYTNPMYFPQAPSFNLIFIGMIATAADLGKPAGKTKVATVACVEAAACAAVDHVAPTYAPKFGLNLVYRARVTITQPDYTSNCQGAQAAGAQIFILGVDANSQERLARSCSQINYRPLYVTASNAEVPQELSDPHLDGEAIGMNVLPWVVTGNPSIAQYLHVLAQYAPGLPADDAAAITGWVSAKLFEAATHNLSDPPTSQSILDGLWSIKNNDLGGLTQPLTFTKNQPAPQVFCYWSLQIKSGKYVSPNNGLRTCQDLGVPNAGIS
jgi:branched-chain amino acid transport system substrate-binding protein